MAAGAVSVPSIIPLRVPIPGKNKSEIDTNTLIELRTEFPDTSIYYTLNGTKPNPFQPIGIVKTTMLYKKPFLLSDGRWTVKTLAITNDRIRESAVGSKTFLVDFVPGGNSDDDSLASSRSASGILNKRPSFAKASNYRKPTTGTRFMESRMGTKSPSTTAGHKNKQEKSSSQTTTNDRKPPETLTQTNRLQRQTDFLKCLFCSADRPADPFARFCIACGNPVPPLPNVRLPPPEPAQLGTCVGCNSMIPFNVEKCLVCEMPIPPQLVPQASIQVKDKLVCRECGTGNPANMEYCVTCEQRLTGANKHLKSTYSGSVAPPNPAKGGRLLCCNKCGRVNNSDARYCDWCGAKPAPTTSLLTCSKCQATNRAYSTFCHSCGCMIGVPPRNDPRNNGITVGGRSISQVIDTSDGNGSWVPMCMPAPPPETDNVGTQTVGLFYKSTKGLLQDTKTFEDKKALQETMSDKKPVLTAISPGKGYWRQQMDHICGHLKAYAQNTLDFRNQIGEPRMGKMVAATVHEDGYELSLNAVFNLRGPKDAFTGKPMGISKGLSDLTEGRKSGLTGSTSSLDSVGHTIKSEKAKTLTPKNTPKKKAKKKVDDKLTSTEKDLLREVGPKGQGDMEEVERLLDEGASPTCENPDGLPVLTVAVINKHFDVLSALVDAGADINKRSGMKNNSALHEAVALGPSGRRGVETLLSLGASNKVKNNKNDTPYDLAVKGGHESVVAAFASTAGQGMLAKLMKQTKKITLDDDGF